MGLLKGSFVRVRKFYYSGALNAVVKSVNSADSRTKWNKHQKQIHPLNGKVIS